MCVCSMCIYFKQEHEEETQKIREEGEERERRREREAARYHRTSLLR